MNPQRNRSGTSWSGVKTRSHEAVVRDQEGVNKMVTTEVTMEVFRKGLSS